MTLAATAHENLLVQSPTPALINAVTIVAEFLRKALAEHKTGTVAVIGLLVAAVVCGFASVTMNNPSFKLPQPMLGVGLLGVALFVIIAGYASFILGHRAGGAGKIDLMRKQYPDEVVVKNVRVTVSGQGAGMEFWKYGENGGVVSAWLDVVNFNPFPIEIERIVGKATVRNSPVCEVTDLLRHKISANDCGSVRIESKLSVEEVKQIAFQLSQSGELSGVGLRLVVCIESALGRIELQPNLETGAHRFVNFRL
jgi:hypothetical protein